MNAEATFDLAAREYTMGVCSLCGSDDIMSNSEDSYCNECKEWMSCLVIVVVPKAPGA